MSDKKKKKSALTLAGPIMTVAALVMGIVGIWTGDGRWGSTAVLVGFPALLLMPFAFDLSA